MAFPSPGTGRSTQITTAATSHSIAISAAGGPGAGLLSLVFIRFSSAPGTVTFSGYTQLISDTSDATDDTTLIYYRQTDGSETQFMPMTTASAVKGCSLGWAITGAADPGTQPPEVSAVAVGTTAANSANPPALTPTGGSKDYLWLALMGYDGEPATTSGNTIAPAGYATALGNTSGTGGAVATNCAMVSATKQATAASEDPGAFTHLAAATGWSAYTVAVHPPASGTAWTQPVPDTLSLSDSAATEVGRTAAVPDTLALADAIAFQADFARSIPDTVAVADAQTIARDIALAIPDTLTLADATVVARDIAQPVADTVGLADSATTAAGKGATIPDTVSVADALTFDRALTLADSVALTDITAQAEEIHIADTLALSDLCDPVKSTGSTAHTRTVDDTVAVADAAPTFQLDRAQAVADTLALADAVASTAALLRTLADTVALGDALTTAGSGGQALAETVNVTDALRFDRTLNLADTVSLSDQLVAAVALARTIADTLALADSVTANRGLTRALADTVALADLLAFELERNLALADTVAVADLVAFQAVLERLLADTLFIADSISSDSIVPTPLPPGWIDRGSRGRIDRAGSGRIDLTNHGRLGTSRSGRLARTVTRV